MGGKSGRVIEVISISNIIGLSGLSKGVAQSGTRAVVRIQFGTSTIGR